MNTNKQFIDKHRQVSSSVQYLLITCNNPRDLSLYVPYKLNQIPKHSLPLKSSSTQLSLLDRLSPRLRYSSKNSISPLVLDLSSPRTSLRSRSHTQVLSLTQPYIYNLIYASLQLSYRENNSILFAHNIFTKYLNKPLSKYNIKIFYTPNKDIS